MSKDLNDIRRKFKAAFGGENDNVFLGVVTEVDEDEFTCTIYRDEQVHYYDVRLRALVNGELQGLAMIPKLQSTVLVCRIGSSNELFVCQFGEIDKIVYTNSKISICVDEEGVNIDAPQTTFNGGENGALVKIDELEKNLESIKSYVEAMNAALPTAFTAIGASTSAAGAAGSSSYKGAMAAQMIKFEKMANDKIKH